MSSYLSDGLRDAAAHLGDSDAGLMTAAAHAIDGLTSALARATGTSEAVVALSHGQDGPGSDERRQTLPVVVAGVSGRESGSEPCGPCQGCTARGCVSRQ